MTSVMNDRFLVIHTYMHSRDKGTIWTNACRVADVTCSCLTFKPYRGLHSHFKVVHREQGADREGLPDSTSRTSKQASKQLRNLKQASKEREAHRKASRRGTSQYIQPRRQSTTLKKKKKKTTVTGSTREEREEERARERAMVLVSQASEGGLVPRGVEVHQLLCGREIARDRKGNPLHQMAMQMANYCYLVADVESKQACIVDPAWDTEGCFAVAKEMGLEIEHALFTHRHFDHTGGKVPRAMTGAAQDIRLPGLFEFVNKGIKCYVGEKDAKAVAKQAGVELSSINSVDEGQIIKVSPKVEVKVLATPGHTPGSVCFQVGSVLCTGDTLFIGSCGRVDLPESNVKDMLVSLNRLSELPPDTLVLPGHNYAFETSSTIGQEKSINGMMMQAVQRFQQGKTRKGVDAEPVAAFLPLPDYLNVCRKVFKHFGNGELHVSSGAVSCCSHDVDDTNEEGALPLPPKASQLESHF